MKARFKLIGLIFCLVLFSVPTFHFQAIPAERDNATDAKIRKATVNLEQNDQKEEVKGKKSAESAQEKGPERGQGRGNGLNGNGKDNFRSISVESGEECYKVIVDNNLFRRLGW